MKKALTFFLASLMLFSIAACGEKTATTTPTPPGEQTTPGDGTASSAPGGEEASYKGKTLTIALDSEPDSLIVQTTKPVLGAAFVIGTLYAKLFEYDENDTYSPALATGYEWVDDTHYRLFLREDAYASNGDRITAADVVYSIQLGADGLNASSYADYNAPECKAEDDYTVLMALNAPSPTVVDNLYDLPFAIVSKSGVEAAGGEQAASRNPALCSTGRYKFAEWKEGQYILLQYNENFYDNTYVPSYEYIKFICIADSASRCLSVQSGDVDVAMNISLADTRGYENSTDAKAATFGVNTSATMWFNCNEGVFTNPDLRKAISYLVDWQACADVLTGGLSTPNETNIPQSSRYYYDSYDRAVDIVKAKELLAQAGYPDGFSFEIKVEPSDGYENVALLIQAGCAAAGVKVTVMPVDYAAWFGIIDEGDFESYLGTSTGMLIVALAYFDDVNTRIMNFGGPQLSDPAVTQWVSDARAAFDFDERYELIANLQKYMIENRVGYGICDIPQYALYSSVRLRDISSDATSLTPAFVRPAAG